MYIYNYNITIYIYVDTDLGSTSVSFFCSSPQELERLSTHLLLYMYI